MKRQKTIALGLSILMACGVLVGCTARTGSEKEPDQASSDPITLDWYVNYSWFTMGWGENLVSQTITEETGVSVNFITPLGNEENKLNSLIDSDSLPDLITIGWWEAQLQEIISQGKVYALNELADRYDPLFYEVTSEVTRNWYTQSDGNLYGYPNSSYTPKDVEENANIGSNQTFLVRKDIYEAIGSPDMTTREGFYNAVVKAAEMFPEVDGNPLIPVGAHEFNEDGNVSFDQYLQNFLAVPYEKNGKKYDRNTDPEYLEWLRMFRRLAAEGYLADDIFFDTRTQTSEKVEQGRYFCMLYQRTDIADQQKILYSRDPNKIYIAIDGPTNQAGDDPVLPVNGVSGWTLTLISKNCKDPERAIRFLDYLMSEHGQMLTYLGVEGVTYDIVDGRPVLKEEVAELLNSDRESYDRIYGADDAYWMLQNNVMQLQWQPEMAEPIRQMAEWTYPYATYVGQYEVNIPEDTELGRIYAATRSLWGETIPQLLLARTDEEFDKVLTNYLIKREAAGYPRLLEEETRQMQENKKKLGLE